MNLNASPVICKLSLVGSALIAPAFAQDNEPMPTKSLAAASAPPNPNTTATSIRSELDPPLTAVPAPLRLQPDSISTQNFERAVAFLRIENSGIVSMYYRLNVPEIALTDSTLADVSFVLVGPVRGLDQIQATERYLRDQGFVLEERGVGNFLGGQLQIKSDIPLGSPVVPAWYANPAVWQRIGEGVVIFGFCVAGGISVGLVLAMRSGSLGRRFGADIRHFEEAPEQSFDDVGGCEHIVEEMRELSEEIKAVREGRLSPSELPRGIIYEGGPGAGKTLLARATAGEVECPFMYVNSASITASRWAGDSTAAVLGIFKEARKARDLDTKRLKKIHGKDATVQGVAIVFLDEFDTIGSARTDDTGQVSGNLVEYNHVVNALLAEMDGVDGGLNQGIIVLAATNMAHTLDSALVRPGRFSRTIHVPTPTSEAQRKDILQRLSRLLVEKAGYSFADEEPFAVLAKITTGDTGDYLRGILAESVSLARREGTKIITQAHLLEAFQRQKFGRAHENYLSKQRQRLVAYHEHGHALVAIACGIDPFLVSMKARGETGGRVILDPNATYQPPMSVGDMMGMILVSLGGRAAEVKYFGGAGITEGAAADLDKCRKLIRRGISFGMLNGVYSEEVLSENAPLPERVKSMIDERIAHGLKVAQEILDIVGEETMNRLVDDSLALDHELTGAEAREFFETRLPADTLRLIRERAEKHLGDLSLGRAYGAD